MLRQPGGGVMTSDHNRWKVLPSTLVSLIGDQDQSGAFNYGDLVLSRSAAQL
jgi:hypothetical protein